MTTERGFIAIARGVLDHPIVGARKPYSRHDAWEWLLFEAAFKSRRYNAGGIVRDLERGQLAHSTRYMAKAWGWPETNVRRFLECLKTGAGTGAMIGAESGAGLTVITICNYERYQNPNFESGAENGALNGATTGAEVAHDRRRKEQGNKVTKDIPGAARSGEPEGFSEWYSTYPRKTKRVAATKAYRKVVPASISAADLLVRTVKFAARWSARTGELQFCPYPASWLNGGEYMDDVDGAAGAGEIKPSRDYRTFTESEWSSRVALHKRGESWPVAYWGPAPGQPGCFVPAHLLVTVAATGKAAPLGEIPTAAPHSTLQVIGQAAQEAGR